MAGGDLFALIEPTVRRQPGAPAIVTVDDQVLSYAKLAQTVASFASHGRQADIGPADRVAIDIANEAVRLCLIFALSRIGAVAVPGGASGEIQLSAVITNRLEYSQAPRTIAFHQDWFTPPETHPDSVAVHNGVPCLLLASSGSTGRKKFMEFSLDMLQRRLDWDDEILPGRDANRLLSLSVATDFGFRNALRTLRNGGLLVGPASSPRATIERLGVHEVGELITTPYILVDLVTAMRRRPQPLPKLHSIITVGGPIAGACAAEASHLFNSNVTNVYGSTETGIAAIALGKGWFAKPGASGRVMPWIELEIIGENDKPLPPDREGEVRVKIDPTFTVRSYINESSADEQPIRDGWFYPGDLGHLSDEGELTITGRVSELINTGGNKISPSLIEERLSPIRGIVKVAAVGIRNPLGFDSIGIAICRKPDVPASDIRKEINRRLNFACDTLIAEVEHLPLNDSGKIDRAQLRALFK